jgi:hypothetical protein
MTKHLSLLLILLALALMPACHRSSAFGSGDQDASTGADTDIDTDVDTDTDADSDSDTDADTDSDVDTDTDVDTDSDTDTATDVDTDVDTDTDTDTDMDTDSDTDSDSDTGWDTSAPGITLHFMEHTPDVEGYSHRLLIGPSSSTDPEDPSWTVLADFDDMVNEIAWAVWYQGFVADISDWAEESVRIAFHLYGLDGTAWYVDDVCIAPVMSEAYPPDCSWQAGFDDVVAPGLPLGWIAVPGSEHEVTAGNWVTTDEEFHSAANSACLIMEPEVHDHYLVSPPIGLPEVDTDTDTGTDTETDTTTDPDTDTGSGPDIRFFDTFEGGTEFTEYPFPFGDPHPLCGGTATFENTGFEHHVFLDCYDEAMLMVELDLPADDYTITVEWRTGYDPFEYTDCDHTLFDEQFGADCTTPKRIIVVDDEVVHEVSGQLTLHEETSVVEHSGPINTLALAFGSSGDDSGYDTWYDYVEVAIY